MVRDTQCEFSNDKSEEEFARELSRRKRVEIEFARFCAKKSDDMLDFFNYHHEDIAEFLGYDRTTE